MVNVSSLWNKPPKQPVKICIIDTGYDLYHPDLPHDVTGWVKNSTCGSNNFTNDWRIDSSPSSHGTHVAGIISAMMNYGSEFAPYTILRQFP
jgi:subtilisin family serine protease